MMTPEFYKCLQRCKDAFEQNDKKPEVNASEYKLIGRLTETKLDRSIRFYNEYVDHTTKEACKKLDELKKEFTKNKYRDEINLTQCGLIGRSNSLQQYLAQHGACNPNYPYGLGQAQNAFNHPQGAYQNARY